MPKSASIRIAAFGFALLLLAVVIGWAAWKTWWEMASFREHFTDRQIRSFSIADRFQAAIQGLNASFLQYEISHDPQDWEQFLSAGRELNTWIDTQKPALSTDREREVLTKIDQAYDIYFAAASKLAEEIKNTPVPAASRFDQIEAQSQRLLSLGYELALAHQEAMGAFLGESKTAMGLMQKLIFGALALLVLLGAGVAALVYRDMIAPLKLRLVESNAIIERQEKLASLGVLAAGVAHEIRNPLTAIKARLYTLQKALEAGTREGKAAAVIHGEINRLERIVRDFLEFARPSEPDVRPLSVGVLLREVGDLLAPNIEKKSVRLHIEPDNGFFVHADPQQIKQVLINLVQNATESITGEGSVTLRALSGTMPGRDTAAVILEVKDTGSGISPDVEKRLFDPFFSTKDGGTGLGLSIAQRIIEKHGGVLQYQTQMNHGTTFGILLPAANHDHATG